jgi:hypothetical protein
LAGPLAEANVTINGKPIRLPMGQPLDLDCRTIEVESNGSPFFANFPEAPGHFWLIVLGETQGKLSAVQLNHIAYDIPNP